MFCLCGHVSSPNAPVTATNRITHVTNLNKIWPQNYLEMVKGSCFIRVQWFWGCRFSSINGKTNQ